MIAAAMLNAKKQAAARLMSVIAIGIGMAT
jgi:hypothetical protein